MRLTSASWTGDMGISLLRNLSFAVTSNSEIFSSVQEMKTYVVVRVHRTANAKRTAQGHSEMTLFWEGRDVREAA